MFMLYHIRDNIRNNLEHFQHYTKMANDEKPFPCTSPGCTMRFANEDHLSIHKKRHILLTIEPNNGSKTPNFVADETPTPTRFIRNCEEVGLFQEIGLMQNINPFDEQFKRAADISTLSTSTPTSTDDALHTPHVFPVSIETDVTIDLPPPKPSNARKNSLMPSLSTSECLTIPSPLVTPLPTPTITVTSPSESEPAPTAVGEETNTRITSSEPKSSVVVTNQGSKRDRTIRPSSTQTPPSKISTYAGNGVSILPRPVLPAPCVPAAAAADALTSVLLRLPDGRIVQIPAIPVGNDPSPAVSSASLSATTSLLPSNLDQPQQNPQETRPQGISVAKLKLKQALAKTRSSSYQSHQALPTPSYVASDASGTDTDQSVSTLSDAKLSHSNSNKRKRGYNSASDPDGEESEKRRKFLERNRAAAYRSRQKRKKWVSSLEAKNTALSAANKLLQNEVVALRSEVAQLKLQLLAHKECPVTLATYQQTTAEQNLPLNGDCLTVMPVSSCSSSLTAVSTITTSSTARQIIILNPTNPTPSTSLPREPSSTSVLLGSSPLVVIPGSEANPSSHAGNIAIRPNSELGQPSVIMSLKLP